MSFASSFTVSVSSLFFVVTLNLKIFAFKCFKKKSGKSFSVASEKLHLTHFVNLKKEKP